MVDKKKTVLIVDDSAVMRRILKGHLTGNGFEVVGEAMNGKSGVKKFKELSPDIVTMDVTLDEMDGIEAMSRIMGYDPAAKVVMVSSLGQEVTVQDAMMLGAKDFILKPYDENNIARTFDRL